MVLVPVDDTLSVCEAYNPSTNSWTTVGSLNVGRRTGAALALAGKIILFGGERTTTGGAFDAVEEYDPSTNKWTLFTNAPMPTPRHGFALGHIGNGIFLVAGGVDGGSSYSSSVDVMRYKWM